MYLFNPTFPKNIPQQATNQLTHVNCSFPKLSLHIPSLLLFVHNSPVTVVVDNTAANVPIRIL